MGRILQEERYDCGTLDGAALYDFAAILKHETEKAVLLDCGLEESVWFPKSVIQDNGDGTWTVPERFAIEKGLV